jgi:hypothetical protein
VKYGCKVSANSAKSTPNDVFFENFYKKVAKNFGGSQKSRTFATANPK